MTTIIRNSVMSLLLFTVLTGLIYPLLVTGIAQLVLPHQANGSIILKDGRAVGSKLLGQEFSDPKYFWGRLSATTPYPYNGGSSSGSNLGPNNPDLVKLIKQRQQAIAAFDHVPVSQIPPDAVTASGSGLDPNISPQNAAIQVDRVAAARHLPVSTVKELVAKYTQGRILGFLGEPRVNVLNLNIALDQLSAKSGG